MQSKLALELEFLNEHEIKSVAISTTAKDAVDFAVLPRRVYENIGMSSFMINDRQALKELLSHYDGKIDCFYIDTELKQEINLSEIAHDVVKETKIIAMKPNDTSVESLDVLIRERYSDNLMKKNILIIGTGNLASKTITRLAERQAHIFVKGRTHKKAEETVAALNMFLPCNAERIKTVESAEGIHFDLVIGVISSRFTEEHTIKQYVGKNTLFIDVGINNFRADFIKEILTNGNELLRLDTRIALPYQMIKQNNYTENFFSKVVGKKEVNGIILVAGGIVGLEGTVIVDKIEQPTQVIGVADGSGGVKKDESHEERKSIEVIKKYISKNS